MVKVKRKSDSNKERSDGGREQPRCLAASRVVGEAS